jgi:hypothetical protein
MAMFAVFGTAGGEGDTCISTRGAGGRRLSGTATGTMPQASNGGSAPSGPSERHHPEELHGRHASGQAGIERHVARGARHEGWIGEHAQRSFLRAAPPISLLQPTARDQPARGFGVRRQGVKLSIGEAAPRLIGEIDAMQRPAGARQRSLSSTSGDGPGALVQKRPMSVGYVFGGLMSVTVTGTSARPD